VSAVSTTAGEILAYILERLGERAAARGAAAPAAADDLFLTGALDSVAVVDFILDLEARFDFAFTPRDFQERRFATARGMAELAALRAGNEIGPKNEGDAP